VGKIASLLPAPHTSPWGGPKPPPKCLWFVGLLWALRPGARWQALSKRYHSLNLCWQYLCEWEEEDVWRKGRRAGLSQRYWFAALSMAVLSQSQQGTLRRNLQGKGTQLIGVVEGAGVPVGNRLASMSLAAVTSVEPTVALSAGARNGWERPWQTTRRRGGNGGSSRAWRCSVYSLKPDTTTAASGTQGAAYKTAEIGRADRGGCGQCRHLGGWEYQIRRDGAFFPVAFVLSPCRRYAIAATIFCGMSGAWKSQP
jgi:Putative transposase of IS4/5 family (DUF4096)